MTDLGSEILWDLGHLGNQDLRPGSWDSDDPLGEDQGSDT